MPSVYGLDHATSAPGTRLSWRQASDWLEGARLYWVVTVRPDGRPHAVPVEGHWLDDTFYFGAAPGTRRALNLAKNPAVVVHSESGERAVILEGFAEKVTDAATLERLADMNEAKYGLRPQPSQQIESTYMVRPRIAFGFVESDFIESATRWRFAGP